MYEKLKGKLILASGSPRRRELLSRMRVPFVVEVSDADDARRTLRALSGRGHEVYTGVCLLDAATGEAKVCVEESRVHFRNLSDEEINAYVASGEPLDRAGSYAIQGGAAGFVTGYEGSYDNIVGLPTERVKELLKEYE